MNYSDLMHLMSKEFNLAWTYSKAYAEVTFEQIAADDFFTFCAYAP